MQKTEVSDVVDFEPLKAVAEYRKVVGHLESATAPEGKEEFSRIARRMRANWKDWTGEDSLHEMAFGEPGE